jgi:leucine dehydrogenase
MKTFTPPIFHSIDGYETVMEFRDEATKLHGLIAVHSTKRGPALGGTRLWDYHSKDEALTDVLRLAKGMTYKAAGADLALGGGKAVLIGNANTIKSPAYFQAYGHFVSLLKGRYITAEDVNTNTHDMKAIATMTDHVVGREGKSGNPSPFTAYGVFAGIQASIKVQYPTKPIHDLSFAIQGVGQTGSYLIQYLADAGVTKITIADINPANVDNITKQFPWLKVVNQDAIFDQPVDVFCPCALGGIINDHTLASLKAKVVAGSANNILLDDRRHGPMAKAKGILVAPDFIINAGGLINVYHEFHADYEVTKVKKEIYQIHDRLLKIYQLSQTQNLDPFAGAQTFVAHQLK